MTPSCSQINRRRFLTHAAALALGSPLAGKFAFAAPAAGSGSASSPIELGFSLYGMKTLSLDAALEACAKIGYDAVELACMPGWPADPKALSQADRERLRDRLKSLDLSLPVLMENVSLGVDEKTNQSNLDRLKRLMDLAHELQMGRMPILETVVGGGKWEAVKQKFADQLVGWARLAEQQQTVIAIKPHRMGAMNTPADAMWLVKQVHSPWIKLAYDYSHFVHREPEMSLAETLTEMLPETVFVHVKDTVIEKGKARFLLPGEGDIDYVELFRQLSTHGYRGCVCVEVSGMVQNQKGYDPIVAARRSYEPLAAAMQKAGLARRKHASQATH